MTPTKVIVMLGWLSEKRAVDGEVFDITKLQPLDGIISPFTIYKLTSKEYFQGSKDCGINPD